MHRMAMDEKDRLRRKNEFDAGLVMGVAAFHQATGRDRHLSHRLDMMVDPGTGLVREDISRSRNCPLCGGAFDRPIFVKNGFPHGRCPDCGLIYVSPVLTDEAAAEYYREEASWVQVLTSGPQIEFDRLKYLYGLDVVRQHFDPQNVLDIGAGVGLFVRTAKEAGLEPTALELHRENAEVMRLEGFEVYDVPLADAEMEPGGFDLATMWEVLEHIADPRSLLRDSGRVLRSGGCLLILVPNADSLATRILHEKSGVFGGHSHVNFFNLAALRRLLEEEGFRVVEAETLITEIGTINNHLGLQPPYSGRADCGLSFLTPELIHRELLGGKLMVVAEKVKNGEMK